MLICYIRAGQLCFFGMLAGVLYVQISYETWSNPRQLMLQQGPTSHFKVTFYGSTLLYIYLFMYIIFLCLHK